MSADCAEIHFELTLVDGGLGDEPVRLQEFCPVERIACHVEASLRGGDGGACAALRKLQVFLVEPGDLLTGLDALPDIDKALHDLARHAETERALDARHDHPGIGQRPFRHGLRHLHHLDGPHWIFADLLFAASGKRQGQKRRRNPGTLTTND